MSPINITIETVCKYYKRCLKSKNYLWTYMRVIWMKKKISNYFRNLYAGTIMDVKKTNNYLQDLYVGIAYLKRPYGNYNKKDVGIAQCSF